HGVNGAISFLAPATQALTRPPGSPGWVSWPNILAIVVGLPHLIGLALHIATSKKRSAALAAGVVAAITGATMLFAGSAFQLGGAALVVCLVMSMLPVVGLPCALLATLVLGALANLPTQQHPPMMQPWLFHWLNVIFHAANGAVLVVIVHGLTKRRGLAWLTGLVFVSAAVLTEAVSGVVGIADVMGGLGACLALLALRLPLWAMPWAVFAGVVLGLFSKESALVCVPLLPFAAILLAPLSHPRRPMRWLRGLLALVGTTAGLVFYVELRKRWFPAPMAMELQHPLPDTANQLHQAMHWFRGWFHQAPLPRDPLNNPLVDAPDFKLRTAGALRVFWRGLVQVVFPRELSGDYSYPQEPVPQSIYEWESVLGALTLLGLPIVSLIIWVQAWRRER
ncbi:MAG: hypothetical protein CSA75_05285, partial [Sorangium cellulosum]